MKKPRQRGAPRVRQVNGVRFVLRRPAGFRGSGWGVRAQYSDRAGRRHHFGAWEPSRAELLRSLHDTFAPRRGARA